MSQVSMRTPEVIAIEINSIRDQAQRILLSASVEIGRRLTEAKAMLPHGEWGNWLADSVDYKQSTANNLMNIFEKYGSDQLSLFGDNTNSQAFANLTYTQAVALLGVPDEERESFVVENNVSEMTTRELQAAIKEKQQAEREREAAEKAKEEAEKKAEKERKVREKLETQQKDHAIIVQRLQAQLEAAQAASDSGDEDKAAELQEEANSLRGALSTSEQQLIDSQARIRELEEQMKVQPVEVTTATQTVYETPPEVLQELETLRKKAAATTGEDTAMFKAHTKSFGDSFNAALGVITSVKGKDAAIAEKCGNILIETMERMKKMLTAVTRPDTD
jgi:chromosome segregation ATPase